jgi:hypothetical protein
VAPDGDRLGWAWAAVAGVAAVDCCWAYRIGFGFHGLVSATFIVGFLLAIGLLYGYSGRNQGFRDLGHYFALWTVFPLALNIYSYLAATLKFPLCDIQLSAIDAAMGFHWLEWYRTIHAHPLFIRLFFYIYDSIFIQGFASIAFFALTRNTRRNSEMLWISMMAGLATVVISGFVPALGPQFGKHLPIWTTAFLEVRNGAVSSVKLADMQGIVAFPSFHTVLAIVFVYVHRPPCRTFWPIAVVNGLMLLSIPVMGHHYFIDVIAGAGISALSIVIYRVAFGIATVAAGESREFALASRLRPPRPLLPGVRLMERARRSG